MMVEPLGSPSTRRASQSGEGRGLKGLLLLCLLSLVGCAGPEQADDARLVMNPSSAVTLSADWRVQVVDTGIWPYEPTELGRLAVSPDGQMAYVGTSDGRMVAVEVMSGRIVWEFAVGEPVDGQPVVRGRFLYFGAADGKLYALSAAGGGEIWTYHSGGNVDSTPATTDDSVIFARADGTVVCLDRYTGVPRWTVAEEDPILRVTRGLYPPVKGQSSPVVIGDRVYVGFPSGRLMALSLTDGATIWAADLAADAVRHTDVDEPPVFVSGQVVAASFTGGLYGIDPSDGRLIWRQPFRGATRPVEYGHHLLTTSVDGYFLVLNQADGDVVFRIRLEDRAPIRVHRIGDYAVVATTQGALYVLDATAPHIHAIFAPSSGFASTITAPGGRVLALDHHGILHGLTLRAQ